MTTETVHIVYEADYDGGEILGVFADKATADQYAEITQEARTSAPKRSLDVLAYDVYAPGTQFAIAYEANLYFRAPHYADARVTDHKRVGEVGAPLPEDKTSQYGGRFFAWTQEEALTKAYDFLGAQSSI